MEQQQQQQDEDFRLPSAGPNEQNTPHRGAIPRPGREAGASADADLDVVAVTKEFAEKVNVPEEGNPKKRRDRDEKRKLNTFFSRSLRGKIEKHNRKKLPKEADVFEELEKVGFGAVLEDDGLPPVKEGEEDRVRNALAVEFLGSDAFADRVASACNKATGAKKRMPYTKMFERGGEK